MQIVENRKKETLLPIIESVCLEGRIIHSDQWPSHKMIQFELGYQHETVNHKVEFVNKQKGVHTQHGIIFGKTETQRKGNERN